MALGDPIPTVADNGLILTTWGNAVKDELNSNTVKRAGTTTPVTGTLEVTSAGTFRTNGAFQVRRSTNQPIIELQSTTGTPRFGYLQALATGTNVGADAGSIRFLVAAVEVAEMIVGGHLVIPGELRPAGGLASTGTLIGGTVRGANGGGGQVQVVDSNGGHGANLRFYGSGASTTSIGSPTGLVGFSGSVDMFVRNEAVGDLILQTPGSIWFEPGNTFMGMWDSFGRLLVGKAATDIANTGAELWGQQGQVSSTVGTNVPNIRLNRTGTGDVDGGQFVRFDNNAGIVGSITWETSDSKVHYNTTSDYRVKNDLGPIVDGVERIKALRPRRITRKDAGPGGVEHDAFIAHEVQAVVPAAVTGDKDAVSGPPPEGEPADLYPTEGTPILQQLDYSSLVTVTIAALQDALAQIETLTARIDALEAGGV